MKLNMLVFCAEIFFLFVLSSAEIWRNESELSVFKILRLSTAVDFEITESIKQEKSTLICSIRCAGSASFYYFENNSTCICNAAIHVGAGGFENVNEVNVNTDVVYGFKTSNIIKSYLQASDIVYERIHKQPEARDCLDLYKQGYSIDGVYVIKPEHGTDLLYAVNEFDSERANVQVWCDMANGGWTVKQRRQDGSVDFLRDWVDYKNGFGNITGEFWLGLDNIHLLTIDSSSLSIELETFGDITPESATAEYSVFRISDELDKYRLFIKGYTGSCSDSLSYHNNSQFSTRDNDNDNHVTANCALHHTGAWWYNICLASNLNGRYLGGAGSEFADGIVWVNCWNHEYSLKRSVMKIRRNA